MRKLITSTSRYFSQKKPLVDLAKYDISQTGQLNDHMILVDENDSTIGQISKIDGHLNSLNKSNPHHRAFSVFLFNESNELLIHQRSNKKITFPLFWTNSCCSHPLYNDEELNEQDNLGVKKAIMRRVKFELGIDLMNHDDFSYMGRFKYQAPYDKIWGEKEIDHCYIIQRDFGQINQFNQDEIKQVKWIKKKDIINFIQARIDQHKENITPWFEMILAQHFFKWWDLVEKGKIKDYKAKAEVINLGGDNTKNKKDENDAGQNLNIDQHITIY